MATEAATSAVVEERAPTIWHLTAYVAEANRLPTTEASSAATTPAPAYWGPSTANASTPRLSAWGSAMTVAANPPATSAPSEKGTLAAGERRTGASETAPTWVWDTSVVVSERDPAGYPGAGRAGNDIKR